MSYGIKDVGPATSSDKLRLTNVSLQFRNPAIEFIHDRVLTPYTVTKMAGAIPQLNAEYLKDLDGKVAPGQRGKVMDFTLGSDLTYNLVDIKFATKVLDATVDEASGGPIDPMSEAVESLTEKLMIQKEIDAAALFAAASANVTLTGTDRWNDFDNSDPVSNIKTSLVTLNARGYTSLKAIMNREVWNNLRFNPALIGLLGSQNTAPLTLDQFKAIFDFSDVLVTNVIKDTSQLGIAQSKSYVWSDDFYVVNAPSASRMMQTYGFYFTKNGTRQVDMEYDKFAGATTVQVADACQFKAVDTTQVYRIATAIA